MRFFVHLEKTKKMAKLSQSLYLQRGNNYYYSFASFPSVKIYKEATGNSWKQHLLFGDYIQIKDLNIKNNRVLARSRHTTGWIKVSELQKERILEINFIDIGQGDGCHIVTPNDEHIIVDAGEYDNMNRYLSWRFNLYRKINPLPFPFQIVISHSDKDHYRGFEYIFKNDKIRIENIFHNGIVERPGEAHAFGKIKDGYITSIVTNTQEMLNIIKDKNKRKGKNSMYAKTLYKVLKYNPEINFSKLSINDKFLKDYNNANIVNNKLFSIEILGPIPAIKNGKEVLKSIKNAGKDKNGHSVLLKLIYDKVRVLLGGDVNTEFGEIIYQFYQNKNQLNRLEMDVAKACHHGSNHFHYDFIEALHPIGTVISSGDDESYAHPRPDAIGAFGKCGYSKTPLIFSTELARSTKEITRKRLEDIADKLDRIEENNKLIKALKKASGDSNDNIKKLKSKNIKLNKEINSHITKFGMINLRTDGQKMIIAQKLEKKATYGKWDIHELEYDENTKRFEHTQE
jgi:beta-lactamase superfamily II metal-dependent hydrolase